MGMDRDLAEGYRVCHRIARERRENFLVLGPFTRPVLRKSLAALYAYLRVSDDIADANGAVAEKLNRLLQWEASVRSCTRGTPRHPILKALQDTIRRHDLPLDIVMGPLQAFKVDLLKSRYRTFSELEEYCRWSANPVGELILRVYGYHTQPSWKSCLQASDAICTGLQLVNHLQHLLRDRSLNRLYFPLDEMNGFTEDDWIHGRTGNGFHEFRLSQLTRIRALLTAGRPLMSLTKGLLSRYVRTVWNAAHMLADKIEVHDFAGFPDGPVRTKLDAMKLIWRSFT